MELNIRRIIREINEIILSFLKKYKWIDFQFSLIQEGIVKLEGCFDLTSLYKTYDKIEIEFFNAIFIKTILYAWEFKKEKPLIEVMLQCESLERLHIIDDIDKNKYHFFKINTDRNESVLVIAESIKYSLIKSE